MERKLKAKIIIISSTTLLMMLVIWPILMVISSPAGSVLQQLELLKVNVFLYRLNFLVASLIALPLSVLILMLAFRESISHRISAVLGAIFIIPYVYYVTIAYTTQYTVFPRLLKIFNYNEALLQLVYFNSKTSVPYAIDLLGYAFFGLSALCVGYSLLYEKGLLKEAGLWLCLSGVFSIFAHCVHTKNVDFAGVFSLASGIILFPFGVILIKYGIKLFREDNLQ